MIDNGFETGHFKFRISISRVLFVDVQNIRMLLMALFELNELPFVF